MISSADCWQATDLPEEGPGLTWSDLEQWADLSPDNLLVDPLWAVRQVRHRNLLCGSDF